MLIGVALFELHIPQAQSLKEKRTVVKSLRDRLRNRFEVSAAEVGLQDLHQRARLGVAAVSSDAATLERLLESIVDWIENEGSAGLVGWTQELVPFDQTESSDFEHMKY